MRESQGFLLGRESLGKGSKRENEERGVRQRRGGASSWREIERLGRDELC